MVAAAKRCSQARNSELRGGRRRRGCPTSTTAFLTSVGGRAFQEAVGSCVGVEHTAWTPKETVSSEDTRGARPPGSSVVADQDSIYGVGEEEG